MTETDMETADKKRRRNKTFFAVGLGAIAGFLGAMGGLRLADSGLLGVLGASREVAMLIGLIYLLTALAVLFGLAMPKAGATFLNVEDADELREQKAMLSWSGAGMIALALALIMAALAEPAGIIGREIVLAAVIVLVGFAWFAGHRQRRHTDELMLSVSREATALCFYLLFLFGGGWSLLAHLNYATAPAPLDWLSMFAGLLLLGVFVASGKRGMLAMR
ncbi:hypothetical protein [Aurantiacibacter sediminis]|uniref:DUF2178 domain-containing protein n=1 Tax=Aurantiacibacter sediminis TaxID=2793064 RepID=A0ABS0N6A9_9SPHN|nr:hypothetical protein [Aurantiacibacter sediminis]MBH5323318.1 hypothetical protein [Aurantiacibacter sediminis]